MNVGPKFDGKRDLLAYGLQWSGILFMLSQLQARDSLLVLNYHRIGDPEKDPWDPGMFSATREQFDEQISYLKRNHSLVTLDEALAFVGGTSKEKTRRCRVLITFDDGYLDNYEVAFPILRSNGVQGIFFLCSDQVGSDYVPWWDHVAYLVKIAYDRRIPLHYPIRLDFNAAGKGLTESLRSILDFYKKPENLDSERLIRELKEALGEQDLPPASRRFLNWDEAREMIDGGMAIGGHSHSHTMLSRLGRDEQRRELAQSRAILSEQLGVKACVLAYPYGSSTAFSEQTKEVVREMGYQAAFSYYGRVANQRETIERYNLKRVPVSGQSLSRFQAQTSICRLTGNFWP
jgi:peptidoglycan/xylan/chitin deacetylase (PgdA/CDA1 family)